MILTLKMRCWTNSKNDDLSHFIFKIGNVYVIVEGDSRDIKKRGQSIFDFECRSFGEFALPSCRFTENVLAIVAGDYGLGVAEDYCGLVAASAFDVHEIGVGGWYESFDFVFLLFGVEGGVE